VPAQVEAKGSTIAREVLLVGSTHKSGFARSCAGAAEILRSKDMENTGIICYSERESLLTACADAR
jgi:hypothetical protein